MITIASSQVTDPRLACFGVGVDAERHEMLEESAEDRARFVKICRLDSLDVDSTSMISGMCMPREQVARYLAHPEAPKYFDAETFKDHLTSTMFAQLVAVGAVGTVGVATELVRAEIESSLRQQKAVTLGIFSDTTGLRPSRSSPNRRRSRSRSGKASSQQPDSRQAPLW